jgi:hypothetical protein
MLKPCVGYGYERYIGLGCKLLGGSKKNYGCQCRSLQQKKGCGSRCRLLQGKKLLWVSPLDLKKNKNPKSRIKWGLSLAWAPHSSFSLSSHFAFFFTLCSPFHTTTLFFALHCCSPLCPALLLSSLHCIIALLFAPYYYSPSCLAVLLFDYSSISWYKVFRAATLFFTLLLLVCCNSLKNLVLPPYIPSCRNWKWLGIENKKPVFFLLLISIF